MSLINRLKNTEGITVKRNLSINLDAIRNKEITTTPIETDVFHYKGNGVIDLIDIYIYRIYVGSNNRLLENIGLNLYIDGFLKYSIKKTDTGGYNIGKLLRLGRSEFSFPKNLILRHDSWGNESVIHAEDSGILSSNFHFDKSVRITLKLWQRRPDSIGKGRIDFSDYKGEVVLKIPYGGIYE